MPYMGAGQVIAFRKIAPVILLGVFGTVPLCMQNWPGMPHTRFRFVSTYRLAVESDQLAFASVSRNAYSVTLLC
jgi:hypothetical protein